MTRQHSITKFSAFSILIVFLVFSLIGALLIPLLSIQLLPEITSNSITVSCHLPNASPQITDDLLATPIESHLLRLKGIKNISSSSGNGDVSITMELDKWTDVELFQLEVSTLLRQLHTKLPKGASYPQVTLSRQSKYSNYRSSVLSYSLSGPASSTEIAQVVEKTLKPQIAKIKGIDKFEVQGVTPYQISIVEDQAKMLGYGVTHNGLSASIRTALSGKELGLINTGNGKFNVYISKSILDINDLENYPIYSKSGRMLKLKEIVIIKQETQPQNNLFRINGEDQVSLNFYADAKVNNIRLANQIRNTLKLQTGELPKGYRLQLNYDSTEYLKMELDKIFLRTLFSILILIGFVLLITRKLRYILIIVGSLVCNLLISFIFYYGFKLEIHLYSLAGITISLGMIIDNVIIITEDIRYSGRNRIFAAILASTATALGALVVIFLLNEAQRVNLIDFAYAIIINLLVSLPVAYFFIPALLEKFPIVIGNQYLTISAKHRKLVFFNKTYKILLQFMLRFKWGFLAFFLICFGLPVSLLPHQIEKRGFWAEIYTNTLGSEFYNQSLRQPVNTIFGGSLFLYLNNSADFSDENNEQQVALNVNIAMPNGATFAQMNEVCLDFEDFLKRFPKEIEFFTLNIYGGNSASINIRFKKSFEKLFPFQLKQLLESKANETGAADFQIYGVGQGFSNAVALDQYDSSIQLKGYNYSNLQQLALRVKDSLLTNPRVNNILISTTDRYKQKPYNEYVVNFTNPTLLDLYKASPNEISNSIQNLAGKTSNVGYLDIDAKTNLPVSLVNKKLPEKWNINNEPVPGDSPTTLKLGRITNITQLKTIEQIIKKNQVYLLNVHYQFVGSAELNSLIKANIVKSIAKILPYGYSISGDEDYRFWNKKDNYLFVGYIFLVLVIIYLICGALLESFIKPLAAVAMIPFSFIGVFLVFYFFNVEFDQGGYAALLMLAGIVTNAALYIINDMNFIARNSYSSCQINLYIKAFNAKLMPIVITTASAILSMIPFLVNGEEKGFWFTLSLGTIGGLLFSLLGIFFLLPLCLLRKKDSL